MVRRILKRVVKRLRKTKPAPPPEPLKESTSVEESEEETLPEIEVHVADLLRWREAKQPFQFIDIREVYEMRQGFIPDSWLIPMNKIPETLEHLPKETTLVLYCAAGMRSFDVTYFLRNKGFSQAWSLAEGAASFAEHGWTFPEDGTFQLCQSIRFTEDAAQNRKLEQPLGTIQHIHKSEGKIVYTIGQYTPGNITIIERVEESEIKPA